MKKKLKSLCPLAPVLLLTLVKSTNNAVNNDTLSHFNTLIVLILVSAMRYRWHWLIQLRYQWISKDYFFNMLLLKKKSCVYVIIECRKDKMDRYISLKLEYSLPLVWTLAVWITVCGSKFIVFFFKLKTFCKVECRGSSIFRNIKFQFRYMKCHRYKNTESI